MFKIIDADRMVQIGSFSEAEKEAIIKQYENDPKWEDVSIDADGDLILFKEL